MMDFNTKQMKKKYRLLWMGSAPRHTWLHALKQNNVNTEKADMLPWALSEASYLIHEGL